MRKAFLITVVLMDGVSLALPDALTIYSVLLYIHVASRKYFMNEMQLCRAELSSSYLGGVLV